MKYSVMINVDVDNASEAATILDRILQTGIFDGKNTGYISVDVSKEE